MFLHVTKANYISDYKVEVFFNNGKNGVADLSDALYGEVFEPLQDVFYFKNFKLEGHTLSWPNGADLAPEYLYFQAFKNDSALQEKFKKWGYIS
jgi:hypothetical protein